MPALLRWLLRLGPTNPICVRLVQGGSRRTRHLYIRTAYLALLITVLMWSLLVSATGNLNYRDLAAAGAKSFEYTAYLQVGLICVLAPVFMAGAIAQEANPATWDILLTTPLSAAQIVLGNLLGRLFFILALLFASLPLFAITQYFGGVPGRAIFASYAIAACAAGLVGAIALALSVSRLAGRRAVFTFYVCVITYLAVTWALDAWLRGATRGVTWLTALNPFLALRAMLSPSDYPTPPATSLAEMSATARLWLGSPALTWCLLSAGLTLLLAAASTTTVRRVGAAGGGGNPLRRLLRMSAPGERRRPPRTVWHNPVAWREASARAGTGVRLLMRWAFVALGLAWGAGLVVAYHWGSFTHTELRFAILATVIAELTVIALVAMNMSGSAVSREREDGTLDLLLITPVTPREYLGGKLRGLISFMAPLLAVPIGTLAIASVYVMLAQAGVVERTGGVLSSDAYQTASISVPVVMPDIAVVAPLVIVPFIAFCVMVGLQWSLKSKGTISSVIATVGVVAALSGIIGACGYSAGQRIPLVGPVIACLNPVSALFILINPAANGTESLGTGGDLGQLRLSMFAGAVLAALVWSAVVYGMLASMVRTFDMTVRKLAGTK